VDDTFRSKIKFEKYFRERWDSMGLDAMISPAYYHSAYKNEDCDDLSFSVDYFILWNVLHYPAGIVPVTEVLEGEDQDYQDGINDLLTSKLRNSLRGSKGMPLCVQVATPKWKDEKCLATMKILENELRYIKSPNL
jgi:fatty acid amide hydrolase